MNALNDAVTEYLQLRRSMGFKLQLDERHLRRFVRFLGERKVKSITTKLALEFATEDTAAGPVGRVQRMCAVRGFARYWQAFDSTSEVPPAGLLRSPKKRAKPRLCDGRTLARLLSTALSGKKTATRGLRPVTLHVVFGLLAVTGMRVSEALALRRQDVDCAEGVLTIRDTKFGKSRCVPVHPSTIVILRSYMKQRDSFLRRGWRGAATVQETDLFFVSNRGTALSPGNLRDSFRRLQRKAGITKNGEPLMRIHDLRHRFAVETLRRFYTKPGVDIGSRLPALSTFLGHVNVEATYWYLSNTPALQAAAMRRVELRWKGHSHAS